MKYSPEDIIKIAKSRRSVHKKHSTPIASGSEYMGDIVGVTGEAKFAELFGLDIDEELYLNGDGGVDFIIQLDLHGLGIRDYTVDVKTYRKPYNVLLKKTKVGIVANILVLASYKDGESDLIGWQFGKVVAQQPKKDFGYGIINHFLHNSKLKDMNVLLKALR